ncbi:MAG: metallophosphoesterase [Clostridia bacterium]|nr:metallophosphoesterase [Clostridia bacterium]
MRLIVISDTHGNINAIKEIESLFDSADKVIHLGDHFYDMDKFVSTLNDKLITVYGNCDGGGEEKVFTLGGVKMLVCHGDRYHVKLSLTRIFLRAKELGASLVLYGHTHRARIDYNEGVTLLNPGSMTRFGKNSYAVIDINDGVITPNIVEIK